LLDITANNNAIPGDWKKALVVPIYKGGDRSEIDNYRPVSLTSVVCKQMEQHISCYLCCSVVICVVRLLFVLF